MAKILVTGGLGFIGSHTVVELQAAGHEAIVVDDLSNTTYEVVERIESISGVRPTFEKMDIKHKAEVETLLDKYADIDG